MRVGNGARRPSAAMCTSGPSAIHIPGANGLSVLSGVYRPISDTDSPAAGGFSVHPMAAALARRRMVVVAARALLQHHGFHFRLGGGSGLPVLVDRAEHGRHLGQAFVVFVVAEFLELRVG